MTLFASLLALWGATLAARGLLAALLPFAFLALIVPRLKGPRLLVAAAVGALGFALALSEKLYLGGPVVGGLVIKSSSQYAVIKTLKGTFYVEESGLEFLDIVKLSGTAGRLAFSHYQESFDFRSYLNSWGAYRELHVDRLSVVLPCPLRPLAFREAMLNTVPERYRALVGSFIFGDSGGLKEEYPNIFTSGLLAVFRLSGLHLHFLFALLEKRIKSRRSLLGAEFGLTAVLAVLSNYRLALVRLSLRAGLLVGTGGRLERLELDSAVGSLLLLLRPGAAVDPSFYLVFPLLFLLNFSALAWRRLPVLARTPARLLLIWLYFVPYNLATNYGFAPLGFLTRLAAVPLGEVGFLLALAALGPLGKMFYPLLTGLGYMIEALDSLTFIVYCGLPPPWFIFVFYLLLAAGVLALELNFRRSSATVFTSLLLALCAGALPFELPVYQVHFIDVGQGDATLIRNGRENYLIDTGGNIYVDLAQNSLIPYLRRQRISRLDKVYITHGDFDHSGALESLKDSFPVGEIYYMCGDDFAVDLNGYRLESADLNYNSAVYSFAVRQTNFLIMGDAPQEIERNIMSDFKDLRVDVLKVGHHGSKTSSSFEFLKFVNPRLAVISCGYQNRYGHPDQTVLTSLEALQIPYHRTDLAGTLVCRC